MPRTAPLIPVAVGFMLGILAGDVLAVPTWAATALFLAGAALVLVRYRCASNSRNARMLLWLHIGGIALAAAALGALRHQIQFRRVAADHLIHTAPHDDARLVRLTGRIISPIDIDSREDRQHQLPFPLEPATRFELQAQSLDTPSGARPASGRVRVTVAAPALHLALGQRVQVLGHLYRFRGPDNPGQFDWATKRRRDGLLVGLRSDNERCVRVLSEPRAGWQTSLHALRNRLHRLLVPNDRQGDDAALTLLDTMVLAQRGRVERALDQAFIRTGTVHFLSASGLNVAWLALIVWGVMFLFGAHYRTTAVVCAAVIVAYAILAEPNPPILRAAITGCLFCAARWLRRPTQSGNWLALAVIIVLLLNPSDLFDAGFQFSFAIVASFLLLLPVISERWLRFGVVRIGDVTLPIDDPFARRRAAALQFFAFSLAVSLLAWLIGLPIAAYHFSRLSTWGWLNSFVMAPLVLLVMVLGFAQLCLAALWPTLGAMAAVPLASLTTLLAGMAMWLARLPGCNVDLAAPAPVWIVAYYLVLIALIMGARRSRLRRAAWLAVPLLIATLFFPLASVFRRSDALRIWTLSVGNGSAHVLELPDGRVIAYDLGSRGLADPASSIAVPFLRHRGIRTLDAVVISHADFDHYGAVEGVARALKIRRIVLNPAFDRSTDADSPARGLTQALVDLRVPVERCAAPDRLADVAGVSIEVLWPPADPSPALRDNDTSTVLRVRYAGKSVLLPGDIEDDAQAALMRYIGQAPSMQPASQPARMPDAAPGAATQHGGPLAAVQQPPSGLKSDVLVLPHHGSATASTLPAFIAAVDPSILIRSSGQRDRDTNPRLWSAIRNRAYYNTAECGAICVTIDPAGVRVESFRRASGRPSFSP